MNTPENIEPRPTRWIVVQEGSRETYAIPVGFQRLRTLRLCYADIWCRWGRSLLRRGPGGARALATRFHPDLPSNKVVSFSPTALWMRTLDHFRRGRLSPEQSADGWCRFGEWYATRVRDHLRRVETDAGRDLFFSYTTNCLETLGLLRERGVFSVVDQVDPGRVEEDLVLEEAERWPGWVKVPGRLPQGYWDRLKAEWDQADAVLVNSEWSADALVRQGVRREKIMVAPLAIRLPEDRPSQPVSAQGTLTVLWLGNVMLRKGIQYLVDAARRLQSEDVQFLVAGPVSVNPSAVATFPSNMKMLGRMTRDQLGGMYRKAHVFVLPTLSDGFGVTQLEAMAYGLPVIATPNCGRVVTDGANGLIVPARDGAALAEAISRLGRDRGVLREMSSQALKTVLNYEPPLVAGLIQHETLNRRDRLRKK